VGALSGLVRFEEVIYLFFWGGRGKEKLLGTDPTPPIHCQFEPFSRPCSFPGTTSVKRSMSEIGYRHFSGDTVK
jgi:hypothetical protein